MNSTSEHSYHSEDNSCVLVIDDDDRVRQMLSLALESAGFDVVAASTQQQAQRRLVCNRPDALVVNLQHSEADGLDLLHSMRARRDLRDVPIVFLACCDSDDFRWQILRAGADWFQLRPVGIRELQKRIAELIRTGRPRLKVIAARELPVRSRRLKLTG